MAGVTAPALDADQRQALERAIGGARRLLEEDLAAQAEGRFGINANGVIDDEESLRLAPSSLADRRELVDVVAHLHDQGESEEEAVAHLIREAAFTHLNRLVAIRIAEAVELLPPSLSDGKASQGFHDLLDLAPSLQGDETGGYWTYLQLCGDELAGDAPILFDPRNPLLRLVPSPKALDELVQVLSNPALAGAWEAPDALGWTYQFFNSAEERRKMREESPAPRNSRELAVRNQFFTPRYVVDFLVQNTLGRRLVESDPSSPLREGLEYLVDAPEEPGAPLSLGEVRVLDPACGSGHFLLGAYEVLERAWELQGVSPEEAAPRILPALWGVDIDPRCAQVASAALIMRARRHCRAAPLPRPNVVTARALPEAPEAWDKALADLPKDRKALLREIKNALAHAPVLGSLLRVEERLTAEIKRTVPETEAEEGGLFAAMGVAPDRFGRVEAEVLAALQRVADAATSTAAERLLAAEAGDAIRFIEAMRQRYDVVLMNPPYGLSTADSLEYLQTAYPTTWTDLYTAFIERSLMFLGDQGTMGCLTSLRYFETRRAKPLRRRLANSHRPIVVVELGSGVLEGATVDTAMAVYYRGRSTGMTSYLDLTRTPAPGRQDELLRLLQADPLHVDVGQFHGVQKENWTFHGADQTSLLIERGSFEPSLGIVRQGCATFDNFRFLRCWWEVQNPNLKAWPPLEKGGEYFPYLMPTPLVIDWRDDGRELRQLGRERGALAQVMQSSTLWRLPALCYPRVGRAFGPRVMPRGEIFENKAIAIVLNEGVDQLVTLGLLNSTVVGELLRVFGRGRHHDASSVKALPMTAETVASMEPVRPEIERLLALLEELHSMDETSRLFHTPFPPIGRTREALRAWGVESAQMARRLQDRIDERSEIANTIGSRGIETRRSVLLSELFLATSTDDHWSRNVVSYLVGCAMGRWDVSAVTRAWEPRQPTHLFEPLPDSAPGMLLGRGEQDPGLLAEYPVELPPEGILLDEPGHQWDIEDRTRLAAALLFEDADSAIQEAEAMLRKGSLRDYLRSHFFKDHLARYSKSHRKAPIYWYLSVPSRSWGVWIYAPSVSRETLFAVAREATRRQESSSQALTRLQSELSGAGGAQSRRLAAQLYAEQQLAEELRAFRNEADRIAALGWEPDLDDGIILCAAPLAELFPAWPDAAKERTNLRKGVYPWASVSKFAERL